MYFQLGVVIFSKQDREIQYRIENKQVQLEGMTQKEENWNWNTVNVKLMNGYTLLFGRNWQPSRIYILFFIEELMGETGNHLCS